MPYTPTTFAFGEQPSASKWNQLGANDAYFDSLIGSGTALASWTPTWSNLTIGNGVNNAKFIQIGKIVHFRLLLTWGSTTSASGSISFTLPVTSVAVIGSLTTTPIGQAHFTRNTTFYSGLVQHLSTTTAVLRWHNVTGAAIKLSNMSGTSPDTWLPNDEFHAQGWYEAA